MNFDRKMYEPMKMRAFFEYLIDHDRSRLDAIINRYCDVHGFTHSFARIDDTIIAIMWHPENFLTAEDDDEYAKFLQA